MEYAAYALLVLGSLFAILSPFATVPAFLAITECDAPVDRVRMARRACLVAFCVLSVTALLGSTVLAALRVSLPALQIAGGLVILRIAFDMLQGERRGLTPEEREEAREKDDVAITPLAIPMLCGPGTITTGIVLGSEAEGAFHYAILVVGGAAIYAMTFSLLWLAARYATVLGQITMRVIGRISGLLLAAIAVEFVVSGLRQALPATFG